MGLSLKPNHLKRYKDIAGLLLKYGRGDIVQLAGLEQALPESSRNLPAQAPRAEDLARDLEALGPTFIKIGQFLSTRPDLLPPAYLDSLSRLQDKVEPFPFETVEKIVSSELGVRMSRAFSEFDPVPVAAASLGQVHRASLRDGRPVAVKVQRPDIQDSILEDLEAIEEVAEFLDAHTDAGRRFQFQGMVEEFRKALIRELDYRQEARNLVTLAHNLESFDRIVVPCPVDDYVTSRVLTMDYIQGRKITRVSPLGRLEIDGSQLADQLCSAYLKQTLVDGFFHADPHPGNVFLTDDGSIALLDLGMVGHLSGRMQDSLLKLLAAVSEARGDDAATVMLEICETPEKFDEHELRRQIVELVLEVQNRALAELQVGRIVLQLGRIAADQFILVPRELTMLGKTLLNVDRVTTHIDPEFDPNAAIRRNVMEITRQRMLKRLSPGKMFAGLLEMAEFAEKLPGRLNALLDTISRNDFRIRVDTIDEATLMVGMQKVANRITLGLVLAALIVGAALLMRVETSFRLFGYPGLAMLFFLAAAFTGLGLVLSIVLNDLHQRNPR